MGRGGGGGVGATYKRLWYLATLWRNIFDRFDCIVSGKFTDAFSTNVDGYYLTGHMEGIMLQT